MTVIAIGISFIMIWLGTTFFIIRYIRRLKNELLKMLSKKEILSKVKDENIDEDKDKPFSFANHYSPEHILTFIQHEHPQVIALILTHLEPDKASVIIQNLPQEVQSDVARRIATLDRIAPGIIREIEWVLEVKLATLSNEPFSEAGGVENTVEILNLVGQDSRDHIIKTLEDEDPELAEELKKRLKPSKKLTTNVHE
jgi:flagellar motor switch protein FliG